MSRKYSFFQKALLLFILLIIALIIFTPYLAKEVAMLNLQQSELFLLGGIIVLGIIIYRLHKSEIESKNLQLNVLKTKRNELENRLDEAFSHIGKINIQINEIRSIFSDIDRYPKNKKDLNYILEYFSSRILSIVNVEWVALEIIDLLKFNTLKSYSLNRKKENKPKLKLTGKKLIKGIFNNEKFLIIKSDQKNLNLKAICILPKNDIKNEQITMIKVIISRLELIYLIFSSHYYKNSRQIFIDNK